MPTENPKISAYVPQVVYDRFKQFQEERGLSMSQAAIELLAEYFGINLADNSTKEYTGGLPSRLTELEQIVANLKQSYVYLSDRVDSIQSTSSLPKIKLDNEFTDSQSKPLSSLPDSSVFSTPINLAYLSESGSYSDSVNLASLPRTDISTSSVNLSNMSTTSSFSILDSRSQNNSSTSVNLSNISTSSSFSSLHGKPNDNLSSELLSDSESKLPVIESLQENTTSELNSGSDDKSNRQLNLIESEENSIGGLLNELKSNPLQGKLLATRLGVSNSKLSATKSSLSEKDFYSWTQEKDFDSIKWVSLGEGYSKGYVPADDTPLEKLQSFKEWIQSKS